MEWWIEILKGFDFDYKTISISDLTSIPFIRKDNPLGGTSPLFRWDNYLTILDHLYPDLWINRSFATQKDGDLPDEYEDVHEPESYNLPINLGFWMESDNGIKTVLNLDIDYFFTSYKGRLVQMVSDEFVRVIAKEIASAWNHIEVFTIALSPEYCGGWDNAVRVAKIITEELNIDWELE